jgi:hypothetical protein
VTQAELDKLVTARANYVQQIVDLSNPAKRKKSYSASGRSYTWTEYRKFLREEVKELDVMIAAAGGGGEDLGGGLPIVTAME